MNAPLLSESGLACVLATCKNTMNCGKGNTDSVSQDRQPQIPPVLPASSADSISDKAETAPPSSAPEVSPAIETPQDKILAGLQVLRQENESLAKQLKDSEENHKKLLNQYLNSLLKQEKEHIRTEVQKLESQLSKLAQDSGLTVDRMRQISEDNKKYNLETVEAFKIQLLKTVWEHIFKTGDSVESIIGEIDKEYSDDMLEKLKKASRNSVKDLKTILDTQFDFVTFCDKNGGKIEAGRHRVVSHQPTDNAEQNGTIAESLRPGVVHIDGKKILYPQWVCAFVFQQQNTESPETTLPEEPQPEFKSPQS